jgi:hypothetical protein
MNGSQLHRYNVEVLLIPENLLLFEPNDGDQ